MGFALLEASQLPWRDTCCVIHKALRMMMFPRCDACDAGFAAYYSARGRTAVFSFSAMLKLRIFRKCVIINGKSMDFSGLRCDTASVTLRHVRHSRPAPPGGH